MNARIGSLYAMLQSANVIGCKFLLIVALLSVLSGCAMRSNPSSSSSEMKLLSPRDGDIAGDWFGVTSDYLYFIRLVLRPDGRGTLVYQFVEELPCAMPVLHWELKERRLFVVVDAGQCILKPLQIHGNVSIGELNLTILGSDWKREIVVRPIAGFEGRMRKLKSATL